MSAENFYEIRDPIYGFITVTEWERDIINHPIFQRLRRIRQLAFTDMIYPGAMHTRFEHSLGVMHLAGKAYDLLTRKPKYRDRLISVLNYDDNGIERARCIVRLAALLHDIGHGPFSHAAESLMPVDASKPAKGGKPITFSHEQYSAAIIRNFFREVIDENKFIKTNAGITADDVAGLLEGDPKLGSHLFWRDILTSQMDVDRMDYLLRDSYHCGVRYGVYDLDRLLHTLAITHDIPESNGEGSEYSTGLTIGVEEGGSHAAEELILSRYAMFTQVYFHKARRAYDYHLEQVLSSELKDGRFPTPDRKKSLEEYLAWDDWRVMGIIARDKSNEHARRIRERDHYREVHHTNEVPSMDDIDNFRAVADALGQMVKLEDSADKSWYKFEKEEIVVEKDDGSRVLLSDIYPSIKGLRGVKQMRLYADEADKAKAASIIQELDGKRREHMTMTKVEIPWERYSTIAYIAERVKMCGKTALQKLVYFLQEWKHVPLGYNYEFYTYGPFSSELMGDLDFCDSLGAVRVEAVATGGFCIATGDRSSEIKDRAKDFLSKHQAAIDEVISIFGKSSAVRLELLATTHYAFAYFNAQNVESDDEQIVKTVHSLKPGKFTTEQIREAISFLREKSVLS